MHEKSRSRWDGDIAVVEREGMGQLSVNAEHASRSDGALVLKISVHQRSQVKAAKVPYCIENVIYSASDRVIGTQY